MRFPNAAKGIKKIFAAEILSLIATVAFSIATVFGIMISYANKEGGEVALGVSSVGLLIFLLGAIVLTVLAMIFKLIGVVQSSKDEPSFKMVLYFVVFGLIVNAILAVFTIFFQDNPFLYSLINSISSVISFINLLLIILGVGSLGAQLGNQEVVLRSGSQFKIILWIGIISLLARLFAAFAPVSYFAQWVMLSFAFIATFLSIVQYILYLVLLGKAKKMLAES